MTTALAAVPSSAPSSCSDTEALGRQITELCGYIYAATYRLLVLIREFDEQDGWHQHGLCSCAHWLNFQCGNVRPVQTRIRGRARARNRPRRRIQA